MTGYFITGTGTGVGKTYVTAMLCRQLREAGQPVSAIKPVISGYQDMQDNDAASILRALGKEVNHQMIEAISPWRFFAPLSVDMAARREAKKVPLPELVEFCRKEIIPDTLLLIEGVGGVMSPLDETHTVLDWMVALNLPVLLVAGSYLGTITHTLSAYHALQSAGLKVHSVIISESAENPVTLEETRSTLQLFIGSDIPIRCVPRQQSADVLPESATRLKCA